MKESVNTAKDPLPTEEYKKLMDSMPICCVDVVFLNKEKTKTLLFKRRNEPVKGEYFTIGGRLIKNEKLLDCAVRQGKRELGLALDPKKLFLAGIIEEPWPNSAFEGISYHDIDIYYGYILESENVEVTFDTQHSDYKWFATHDPSLHPNIKERILRTLEKVR